MSTDTDPDLTRTSEVRVASRRIAVETLRRLLAFNPETGELTWLNRPQEMFPDRRSWGLWNTKYAGKAAFNSLDGSGYRSGGIFNRTFRAHRVAWALAHGEWPRGFLDHINGDKTDNRLANLRDVTRLENARNMPRPKNNTSGVLGVSWSKSHGKWAARIKVEGRKLSAGHFDKFEDACAARRAANVTFGFNENHGRG